MWCDRLGTGRTTTWKREGHASFLRPAKPVAYCFSPCEEKKQNEEESLVGVLVVRKRRKWVRLLGGCFIPPKPQEMYMVG